MIKGLFVCFFAYTQMCLREREGVRETERGGVREGEREEVREGERERDWEWCNESVSVCVKKW